MKTWPLLLLLFSPLLFPQKAPAPNWVQTFDDEFNTTELDLARWVPHDPWGHVSSVQVSGGQLHLATGPISTFGTFAQLYGRFEVRCRVLAGARSKPRFRLLPVPLGQLPAIDIFETTGSAPSKISFANRWGTEQTERSFGDSFTGPDLSTGFHILAIEWDRDKIVWYIDGKEKFQSVDGIPRQPMFLLLDPGVAAGVASFDIDYIRVYRRP
jgi:beta-glucanase (GH16 family)